MGMKVLIGCETSGVMRRAFAAHGHEVWSCDLLPADDASSMHLQCDVRVALRLWHWDLFICHPTCRFLSSSGLHWNRRGVIVDGRPRAEHTEEAIAFAVEMAETPHADRTVMENPVGCLSTRYREPDQYFQPYQFGDNASKKTCLWLRGVTPIPIDSAKFYPPRIVNGKSRWGNQTDSGQNKLAPSADRWKQRSETYPGFAAAAAAHWSRAA